MKNKFMTKALAVVLSASMALSLSSATALTANAAAAPKLNKKAVTVKEGKKKKVKLKAASYKAGWRISKVTVKKTAIAKAKKKKNNKVVVVTGVKKGATKIVLKLKNAKTGAAKKLKFKAKVTVDKPVIEEPVVTTASLTSVKQTAADTAVITFDRVPDTDVTIDTLKIYEGGKEYVPTAVIASADKLSVSVSYAFAESTDTVSYTYSFKDANLAGEVSFTTGKYTVGAVVVDDQNVEAGSLQPVKFSLQTSDGLDVTKYGDYLNNVTVEFTGDDIVDQSPSSSKPEVYLAEPGKTCKVNITYLAGQEGELKDDAVITAIQPTKTTSKPMFADNYTRWYIDNDNISSLSLGTDASKTIYFYAKHDDESKALGFSAVEFVSFELKNNNEKAVTADVEQITSQLAAITINTSSEGGSAVLTLTAKEDKGGFEIDSDFELPVKVTPFNNNASTLFTNTAAMSMTNAFDSQYAKENTFEYGLKNSNDEFVEGSYSIEILDKTGEVTAEPFVLTYEDATTKDKAKATVYAPGVAAGTYRAVITATGIVGSDTKEFKKTVNITVKDVDKEDLADNVTFKYEVVLGKSALKLEDDAKDDVSDIKIKATRNNLFVGYVRFDGIDTYTIGEYDNVNSKIKKDVFAPSDISIYVLSGASYIQSNGSNVFYLGNADKKFAAKDAAKKKNGVYASGNRNDAVLAKVSLYESEDIIVTKDKEGKDQTTVTPWPIYYFGDGNANNSGIAPTGTYSVIVYANRNAIGEDGKIVKGVNALASKKSITVSYKFTSPAIDYNKAAGNTYATPDQCFLGLVDPNKVVEVVGTGKKYKDITTYASAKKNKMSVGAWVDNGSTTSLSAKDKVYGTSIYYDDRAKGLGIYFVTLTTHTITE